VCVCVCVCVPIHSSAEYKKFKGPKYNVRKWCI